MLVIIFCAVAAFIRVDPEMTSGPTSATTAMSAALSKGVLWLQVMQAVLAPRARAYATAETTYGVRPLAESPSTTSFLVGRRRAMSRWPSSSESSLTSTGDASAFGPPAMMYCTVCGVVEKYGGHSQASSEAMRPLEPAPM